MSEHFDRYRALQTDIADLQMIETQRETPRVNAIVRPWSSQDAYVAMAELARALERENAALRKALTQWARWYDTDSTEYARDAAYTDTVKLLTMEGGSQP